MSVNADPRWKRVAKRAAFRLLHAGRSRHAVNASINGVKIQLSSSSIIAEDVYANAFERLERSILTRLLAAGDLIVDVGANVGVYSCLLARHCGPSSKVLAFEPTPTMYSALCGNIRRNGLNAEVDCRADAVSDQPGRQVLLCFPEGLEVYNSLGASRAFTGAVGPETTQEVRVTTLDAELGVRASERKAGSILFIKIDVEGFEQKVLLGGQRTLAAEQNAALMVELYEPAARQCGHSVTESIDLLRSLGYEAYRLAGADRLKRLDTGAEEALVSDKSRSQDIFFLKGNARSRLNAVGVLA